LAFEADPYGGVQAIRRALWADGVEVTRSTAYRELERCENDEQPITKRAVNRYAHVSDQLLDMQMGYRDGVLRGLENCEFTMDQLHYGDETEIVWGLAHHSGYSATRLYASETHKSRGDGKLFLHGITSNRGWVKVWLTSDAGNDATVRRFMLEDHPVDEATPLFGGKRVFGRLKRNDILMWDRLGRAGRAQYPMTAHYNLEIKAAANEAGIGLGLLTPKGAEFNPIELAFLVLKAMVYSMQPPGKPKDEWGHLVRGPRTKAELVTMIHAAVEEMNKKPSLFRHFYHRRALGSDAFQRWQNNEQAVRVSAARAARPLCAFSLVTHAFAPLHTNIHAQGPPKTAAQRKAFERYRAACVAHGLPDPEPLSATGDGAPAAGARGHPTPLLAEMSSESDV
jgi:hypothetical protein